MDKQPVMRRARIAMLVFFSVLTVAILLLWVWSHWTYDSVHGYTFGHYWWIESFGGVVEIECVQRKSAPSEDTIDYDWHENFSVMDTYWEHEFDDVRVGSVFYYGRSKSAPLVVLKFSYWLPTLLICATNVMLWYRPPARFSLRTLLIATTLVAVSLGLACYTVR